MTKKVSRIVIGCVLLFLAVMIIWVIVTPEEGKEKEKITTETVTLVVGLRFDGAKFFLSNKDPFPWTNVKLEINSGLLTGGYILKVKRIKGNEIYVAEALQFAKENGERLNPFTTKPQNISINCDVPGGKGYWYGGWD